jgi:hypothetical protein
VSQGDELAALAVDVGRRLIRPKIHLLNHIAQGNDHSHDGILRFKLLLLAFCANERVDQRALFLDERAERFSEYPLREETIAEEQAAKSLRAPLGWVSYYEHYFVIYTRVKRLV